MQLLAGVASIAWIAAAYAAIRIVGMAPAGQRLSTLRALGWWNLDQVKAVAGTASARYVTYYGRAFLAFFAAILLLVAGTMLFANSPNASSDQAALVPLVLVPSSSLES